MATGNNHKLRLSVLAALYIAPVSQALAQSSATQPAPAADASKAEPAPGATQAGSSEETTLATVVVTGSTR